MAGLQFARSAVIGMVALVAGLPAAAQDGNAERGAALAEAWCAECHIIDRAGTGTVRDAAPAFPTIAADPSRSPEFLRGWLQTDTLHRQMPNLNVGRRDAEDLIAYFRVLARK